MHRTPDADSRTRSVAGARAAALAAGLVGSFVAAACGGSPSGEGEAAPPDVRWEGEVLRPAVPKPSFTFSDTRGEPFSFRDETDGRVALLFFGYTHCPDVCPVQMASIGAVLDALPSSLRRRVRVVFVTVDPERDDRERIRAWLDRFGEGFVGLRAPRERVDSLQRELGLPVSGGRQSTSDGGYTIGHAAQMLAFTPDDSAHLAYPFGTRQRDWARDVERLARQGWNGP